MVIRRLDDADNTDRSVDSLEKLENWLSCEHDSCAHVRVVPGVTDVPVSPSSVVT